MTTPDMQAKLAKDLIALRKKEGLTESKVLRSSLALMQSPLIDKMVEGQDSGSNRAKAVCALIHHFLHRQSDERDFRALASAFNMDVSEPWQGQIVTLSGSQLMKRRSELAELEHVSADGRGKPMSQWEDDAVPFLAQELLGYVDPPITLDGFTYVAPVVEAPSGSPSKPVTEEQEPATDEPPPITEPVQPQEPAFIPPTTPITQTVRSAPAAASSGGSNAKWLALAAGVFVLLGIAFLAGTQLGGSGDGNDGTDIATGSDDEGPAVADTVTPEPADAAPATRESETVETEPDPTPIPEPTAVPAPQPTATPAPSPTPEPTPIPSPTATPEPNAVSGFDLNIVNYSMDDETIERPVPTELGGIAFEQSVNWGVNGRGTFHRSDWFFVEFPAGRRFNCLQMALGLSTATDPEFTATFIVLLDGEEYEQRVMDKFDLWRVDLTGLSDTGFVEVRWQFPRTDEEGYGVIADPIFFRSC